MIFFMTVSCGFFIRGAITGKNVDTDAPNADFSAISCGLRGLQASWWLLKTHSTVTDLAKFRG
jgi:hypothetical protein